MNILKKLLKPFKLDRFLDRDVECQTWVLSEARVKEFHDLFLYYTFIATVIVILLLASLVKRRHFKLHLCHARPGISIPVNFIQEQNNRVSYLACIVLASWSMLQTMLDKQTPEWVTASGSGYVPLKLVYICLLSIQHWPLFASLSSCHVVGYAVGSLYIWWMTAKSFLNYLPCERYDDYQDAMIYCLKFFPLIMFSLFLCISMPLRFLQLLLRETKYEFKLFTETANNSFCEEHVKRLLNGDKSSIKLEVETKINRVLKLIRSKFYKPIPGFRYSLGILAAVWIGTILVFLIAVECLQMWWHLSQHVLSVVRPLKSNTTLIEKYAEMLEPFFNNTQKSEDVIRNIFKEILFLTRAVTGVVYTSLIASFCLTTSSLMFSLRNYRKDLLYMYRGKYKNIPDCSKWTGREILVPSVKYTGYQLGHAVWGFIILLAVFTICLSVVLAIAILIWRYKVTRLLYWLLERALPALFVLVFMLFIQNVIVYYFFLLETSEGKKVKVALNNRYMGREGNRNAFFNYYYFMFFINAPLGIFTCLLRIVKSLVFGLWILPRLDISALTRHTESFDSGFECYVSMVMLENAMTHPVMLGFIQHLWTSVKYPCCSRDTEEEFNRYRLVRNRWHVLLTLYNNPSLIKKRKEKTNPKFGVQKMLVPAVPLPFTIIEADLNTHL